MLQSHTLIGYFGGGLYAVYGPHVFVSSVISSLLLEFLMFVCFSSLLDS